MREVVNPINGKPLLRNLGPATNATTSCAPLPAVAPTEGVILCNQIGPCFGGGQGRQDDCSSNRRRSRWLHRRDRGSRAALRRGISRILESLLQPGTAELGCT